VTVADRAPPLLADALTPTVPLPAPDPPPVIVSHGALLTAVHEHQLPTLTSKEPLSPP
jgi:hypothetical protein